MGTITAEEANSIIQKRSKKEHNKDVESMPRAIKRINKIIRRKAKLGITHIVISFIEFPRWPSEYIKEEVKKEFESKGFEVLMRPLEMVVSFNTTT